MFSLSHSYAGIVPAVIASNSGSYRQLGYSDRIGALKLVGILGCGPAQRNQEVIARNLPSNEHIAAPMRQHPVRVFDDRDGVSICLARSQLKA